MAYESVPRSRALIQDTELWQEEVGPCRVLGNEEKGGGE